MKILLDTNIALDILLERHLFYILGIQILESLLLVNLMRKIDDYLATC